MSDYTLEEQLKDLQAQYVGLSDILDQLWAYHPDNPEYVNPIQMYNEVDKKLLELEAKINTLEFKINSKN